MPPYLPVQSWDMSWLWGSANAAKWQWLWVADSVEELLGSYVLVLRTRWVALEHRMPGKSALHQPPLAQSSDVGSSIERLIQVLWQHYGHAHWNDEVWIFPDAVASKWLQLQLWRLESRTFTLSQLRNEGTRNGWLKSDGCELDWTLLSWPLHCKQDGHVRHMALGWMTPFLM